MFAGLWARWEGDTTPPPTFTCRELRECDSVAVRVPQHGVRLNRISHITLAYVFTHKSGPLLYYCTSSYLGTFTLFLGNSECGCTVSFVSGMFRVQNDPQLTVVR